VYPSLTSTYAAHETAEMQKKDLVLMTDVLRKTMGSAQLSSQLEAHCVFLWIISHSWGWKTPLSRIPSSQWPAEKPRVRLSCTLQYCYRQTSW